MEGNHLLEVLVVQHLVCQRGAQQQAPADVPAAASRRQGRG